MRTCCLLWLMVLLIPSQFPICHIAHQRKVHLVPYLCWLFWLLLPSLPSVFSLHHSLKFQISLRSDQCWRALSGYLEFGVSIRFKLSRRSSRRRRAFDQECVVGCVGCVGIGLSHLRYFGVGCDFIAFLFSLFFLPHSLSVSAEKRRFVSRFAAARQNDRGSTFPLFTPQTVWIAACSPSLLPTKNPPKVGIPKIVLIFLRASESRWAELYHHHRDRVRVLQQIRAVVGADGLQLLRSRGSIADELRVLAGFWGVSWRIAACWRAEGCSACCTFDSEFGGWCSRRAWSFRWSWRWLGSRESWERWCARSGTIICLWLGSGCWSEGTGRTSPSHRWLSLFVWIESFIPRWNPPKPISWNSIEWCTWRGLSVSRCRRFSWGIWWISTRPLRCGWIWCLVCC